MTGSRPTLLALVVLLAASACSQRVAKEDEYASNQDAREKLPESALPPELSGGSGSPRTGPSAGPMTGGPGAGPMSGGAGASAAQPAADAIRGRISLPAGAEAPSGAVLFLFVRQAGVSAGPPLAVQRHSPDELPLTFAIGSESAMMQGTTFPAQVTVEAHLDADGNAMTSGPDDWIAKSDPVAPGTTGVDLVLSH